MLARTLSRALSRQGYGEVVDATGLDGKYEIELSWAPAQPLGSGTTATSEGIVGVGQPSTPAVDLFSAVRESLGLRLEPRRTSADILIVDHIERVPTEN